MANRFPTTDELISASKSAFKSISKCKPIRISGNLIKQNDNSYIGKSYFSEYEKNTKNNRSKNPNDFSGIYVFYKNRKPMYVGISDTIIRRLKQHLFGKRSNEASFVYLMARDQYEKDNHIPHNGLRSDFPFEQYRETIQHDMKDNWHFIVYPMEGGFYLSFIEIYLSAALETKWNSFDPH